MRPPRPCSRRAFGPAGRSSSPALSESIPRPAASRRLIGQHFLFRVLHSGQLLGVDIRNQYECFIDKVADPTAFFAGLTYGKPMSKMVKD